MPTDEQPAWSAADAIIERLRSERDDLLAACKTLMSALQAEYDEQVDEESVDHWRAAIELGAAAVAKAEGDFK